MPKSTLSATLAIALGLGLATAAHANCPTGWTSKEAGKGVRLCQKGGLFVQRVDLSSGARVRLAYQFTSGAGSQSNPNPPFQGRDILEWWSYVTANNGNNVVAKPAGRLFSVVSGSFFVKDYWGNPIQRPAYPVKNRGSLLSIGNDSGAGSPLREFRMNDSDASIVYLAQNPQDWNRTHSALGPFTSVVGLHPGDGSNGDTESVGRSYVGLRDNNRDGKFEWVMFLSTNKATKAEVYAALTTDFGSTVNIQFDGSGTAQLATRNAQSPTQALEYVKSSDPNLPGFGRRNFPVAFVVYEAP
jgi:hypothetical protein